MIQQEDYKYILYLMKIYENKPKLLSSILHEVESKNISLKDYWEQNFTNSLSKINLDQQITRNGASLEKTSDLLVQNKVQIITFSNERLGSKHISSPIIFSKGNLSLLNKPSLAICGPRQTSSASLKSAFLSAFKLAKEDLNIISGYAKGVDYAAHQGALTAGGFTTAVIAEGILNFKYRGEFSENLLHNKFLILSPFLPFADWQPNQAMIRNNLICELADLILIIEPGVSDGSTAGRGSFHLLKLALKKEKPLFIITSSDLTKKTALNKIIPKDNKTARILQIDNEVSIDLQISGILNALNDLQKLKKERKPTRQPELF